MSAVFVVRKAFKTNGVVYEIGDLIEDPSRIRLFNTKLKDNKIMRVDEHNAQSIVDYTLARAGIDIKEKVMAVLKPVVQNTKDEVVQSTKEKPKAAKVISVKG